tara:strand:+ start:20394 stop:21953 length:1560 start_codon:yes stop_codon:yes gene_type:complete
MAKDLFDPSYFSGPFGGFDLFGNAIRKSMEYDYYDSRTTFKAIVLTDPKALNAAAAAAIDPTDAAGTTAIATAKWIFKGRILDHNSPHDFLPDPCNPDLAANKKLAAQIINMHTTFTTGTSRKPGKFNIVLVELDKGQFSFNLQYGRCLDILQNSKVQASAFAQQTDCQSIADNFDPADKAMATAQYGANFMMPTQVAYKVTSLFSPPGTQRTVTVNGVTKTAPHRGWDINAPGGTALFAMCPGTAVATPGCGPVGTGTTGGRRVTITCKFPGGASKDKFKVVYKHMGAVALGGDSAYGVTKNGPSKDTDATNNTKVVGSGDFIGYVNSDALTCSQGAHLHFEIWKNGVAVDPAGLLGYSYANTQTAGGSSATSAPYDDFAAAFIAAGSDYQALTSDAPEPAKPAESVDTAMEAGVEEIKSSSIVAGKGIDTAPDAWYGTDTSLDGTKEMNVDVLAVLEDKSASGGILTMDDYESWASEQGKNNQDRSIIVVEWDESDTGTVGAKYLYDFSNNEFYTEE